MATSVRETFNFNKDKTFNACQTAIATLGYSISNSQKDTGIIAFETGLSVWTWKGQKLTCTLIEVSDTKTDVIISGILKGFALTDWGEAKKIANKVFNNMKTTLN